MKETKFLLFLTLLLFCCGFIYAQEGLIQEFEIKKHKMTLERLARPGTPFDKVGRKFAILGDESGTFEALAYPLKILRNFEISFFLDSSTRAVKAGDITLGRKASQLFSIAKKTFEEKFWDKDSQFYVYAFNTEGEFVKEISPWNAVGLMWKLGTPERAQDVTGAVLKEGQLKITIPKGPAEEFVPHQITIKLK